MLNSNSPNFVNFGEFLRGAMVRYFSGNRTVMSSLFKAPKQ